MNTLKELYDYREMIVNLTHRDLRGRYKGSALGFFWTLLNPLLQLVVYTIVFSVIMRTEYEKYYLFLFIALVPWLFFYNSVIGGAAVIWNQKDMINKIYFPREVLPISHVLAQAINMLLSFIVIFAVLIVTKHGINVAALCFLPLVIIIEVFLSLGMAFIVSAVTVFFRDLQFILSIVMMAWQFMSPVMYGIDMVPEQIQGLFKLNPMTSVLSLYRDILYYKSIPNANDFLIASIFSILILVLGILVFEFLKKKFSEEL